MNKKGVNVLIEWTISLVFLMMIIAIFSGIAFKLKDSKLHNLRVEAREYAFARDAILSVPNSVHYNYKQNNEIDINTNNERCIIQAKYIDEKTKPTTFFCAGSILLDLEETKIDKKTIRIIKDE